MTLDELMMSAGIAPASASRRPPHRNNSAVFFHWDSLPDGRPASGGPLVGYGYRPGECGEDDYGGARGVSGAGGVGASGLRKTRSAESVLFMQRPKIVVDGTWDEEEEQEKRGRRRGRRRKSRGTSQEEKEIKEEEGGEEEEGKEEEEEEEEEADSGGKVPRTGERGVGIKRQS